jgi:hypothetical protein
MKINSIKLEATQSLGGIITMIGLAQYTRHWLYPLSALIYVKSTPEIMADSHRQGWTNLCCHGNQMEPKDAPDPYGPSPEAMGGGERTAGKSEDTYVTPFLLYG